MPFEVDVLTAGKTMKSSKNRLVHFHVGKINVFYIIPWGFVIELG